MSQIPQPPEPQPGARVERSGSDISPDPTSVESAETPMVVADDQSTIGTGTSMALGCIAGTVVLIIFGLLFLAVSTLV